MACRFVFLVYLKKNVDSIITIFLGKTITLFEMNRRMKNIILKNIINNGNYLII